MRQLTIAGLLGLAAITATGTTGPAAEAAPASARPPMSILGKIPAPARELMLAQAPLVDAASVIRTAVEAGPPRGYAGLGLVGDHVALWWRGTPPADIATAVTTAQRIAPVAVERAAYSGSQLKAAAARLAKVVDGDAAHGVRIRTDGSGLEVLVDTSAGAEVPALPEVGVPARTVRQRQMSRRSTRLDDSAPWNGGASILRDPGVLCTAGFGVRDVTTGSPYLITAGHCGDLGAEWMDRTGEVIGTTVRRAGHDDEMIATTAAGNKVYVGGSSDGVQARVAGWTEVFPGQLLCQSGNTSAEAVGGPICNLEVQFHYTEEDEGLVEATQLDGEESARGGDSGGPVYAVTAQGTLLAAGTTTRSAGPGFGFQDFATYRDDFGDLVPVTEDATGACRVSYQITDSWAGGYVANVTIYNSGADITGWQLTWSLPADGVIQGRWNAVISQSGTTTTAVNESYNARIAAGGAVTFGFTAAGSPAVPAPITLNGVACS